MGFTGLYWVLLGFTGFYWVLPSFAGFYWVLLGFTGFYLVLPSFTGFYWVLLGLFVVFGEIENGRVVDVTSGASGSLPKWATEEDQDA